MFFTMKEHIVIYIFLLILLSYGCEACFKENSVSNSSIITSNGFYKECCCSEDGYTIDDLQWLEPDNSIIGPAGTASNVYIEKREDDEDERKCISLFTPSASKAASGIYRCVTKYKGVTHSQTHHIDVFDPLFFINKTPTQYILQNANSIIECKARGAAEPLYRWYRGKDEQEEIFNDSVKYQFVDDGVMIKNVTDDDAGIYKCTASVPSTGEEDELDIDVQVMTIPLIKEITASPEDTVIEGESLTLECIYEGFPNPVISWRHISDSIPAKNRTKTWVQKNNTIRFLSIDADDAGIYECFIKNFAGNASRFIEIKVLVPPKITLFPSKTSEEGTDVSILCTATGNPTPNITITYKGQDSGEELDITIDNFSLIKVNRTKEGIYVCNATNEVDSVTEEMYLKVLHKPYFDEEDEHLWGWIGESVEINCIHEASPPGNLTWKYEKNADAIVDVAELNDVLNSIEVKTSRKYTFNVSDNFAPYGNYECVSTNYLGKGYKFIDLQKGFVPSVINQTSVANVTATTATFDISPITYKGPEVIGINAEYDIDENFNVTHIHRNRTWAIGRPFKLEKLKPNSTYYIRFAAINRVGCGPWGASLTFETLEKSAPEPPIWQVDSPQLLGNVLKWKAPDDNGEPIDHYVLRYCPVLDEAEELLCKVQRIEGTTEQELSDLQFNTTYYVELSAHNAKGYSTASNITVSVPGYTLTYEPLLSQGAIIGISIVLVFICLIILDLLLLFWRQQGIIASCCYRKSKKKPNPLNSRDKKGLLKDGESTDDTLRRSNNGHREYEYNKTTGIITGKHSSV